MDLEIIKRVGIAAAYKGAGVLLSHFGRISEINKKGAVITDFSNNPFTIDKKEILTTNGKIHKEMLALLKIVK
ncbi:MAG: hypothetical protein U9Q38_02815 [Thermodesulfobacteriota bacterium]|nr:hypothetical protein [Thermodesulfobacteriota bacterium]